ERGVTNGREQARRGADSLVTEPDRARGAERTDVVRLPGPALGSARQVALLQGLSPILSGLEARCGPGIGPRQVADAVDVDGPRVGAAACGKADVAAGRDENALAIVVTDLDDATEQQRAVTTLLGRIAGQQGLEQGRLGGDAEVDGLRARPAIDLEAA